MTTIRAFILPLVFLAAAQGAQDAGALLAPGAGELGWRPLIDSLAAKGTVLAPFTEHRFFPFRRDPVALTGILRYSPERGLSLQYVNPEPSVLIADTSGLLLRDRQGRSRELPSESREAGAIASLLSIMRFDLAALYPRFIIHAFRTESGWGFRFTPRDPEVARSLGEITVEGSGSQVRHLEFKMSSSQRVEIDVGENRSGTPFAPAELRQFFR